MRVQSHRLDLYYRHARCENMLVTGSDEHRDKLLWLHAHVAMFQSLGWNFITLDLSGEFGPHDIIGDTWSHIERRALRRLSNACIRVNTLHQMANAIGGLVDLMEDDLPSKTVILHFGDTHPEPSSTDFIVKTIRRIIAYRQGVWVVLPTLQALPLEFTTKLFHAHMVLDRATVSNVALGRWADLLGVDLSDWNKSDIRSIFVFNGRSEGAKGQVLVTC